MTDKPNQDQPKARLPFGPDSDWYRFVTAYESLPLKPSKNGRIKSILAHSKYLPAGVLISSTFSITEEVGRVSIDIDDFNLVSPPLVTALRGWGWEVLRQGTTRIVFRKALQLEGGGSTMSHALSLILEKLGVEPNQDWGN